MAIYSAQQGESLIKLAIKDKTFFFSGILALKITLRIQVFFSFFPSGYRVPPVPFSLFMFFLIVNSGNAGQNENWSVSLAYASECNLAEQLGNPTGCDKLYSQWRDFPFFMFSGVNVLLWLMSNYTTSYIVCSCFRAITVLHLKHVLGKNTFVNLTLWVMRWNLLTWQEHSSVC